MTRLGRSINVHSLSGDETSRRGASQVYLCAPRRRVGRAARIRPGMTMPTGRLNLQTTLRDVRCQPLAGGEQLLLIHDVVTIEYRPRLMAGKQHGNALRHAGANQVPRGRSPAVMQEPMRNLGLPARVAQRSAPDANGDAVPAEHARVLGTLQATAP